MEEKRAFGRVPFEAEVLLEGEDSLRCAELVDISLRGARVRCTGISWAAGAPCRLLIPLGETARLRIEAEVTHPRGEEAGMKFIRMDPETFSHLVRLLELNTGDGDRVEAELRALAGSVPTEDSAEGI